MMNNLELFLKKISDAIWGDWLIFIFLGIGLYFTIITGFIQIRKLPFSIKEAFFEKESKDHLKPMHGTITSLQALFIALSSCVGNGNIVGVATALVSGGPGAILWMWIAALLGCATKYAEIVIGMIYREKDEEGNYVGGPIYYISKGLKLPWLASIFAVLLVIQSSGGNLIQSNALANSVYSLFGIPKIVSAFILAFTVGLVVIGGIKTLTKMAEKVVPLMSILYLIGGITILAFNFNKIPEIFRLIVSSAFTPQASVGGIAGYSVKQAMRFGIARGLYSNEAGEGSAPAIHAVANVDHPVRQGVYGILEVIIDTIIMCSITAFSILNAGLLESNISPSVLTIHAFETIHPFFKYVVGICMILFAYTSIPVQWYLGTIGLGYVVGPKKSISYKYIFVGLSFIGCLSRLSLVWSLMDIILGFLVIPNLIAILYLSPLVYRYTKEFFNPLNGFIKS